MTTPDNAADVTPYHDRHAEFALLACLVWGEPDVLERTWNQCSPEDFYVPHHETLASIIHRLDQVDVRLLPNEIRKIHDGHQIDQLLRLLTDLATWQRIPEHVELYAQSVRTCARRRALQRLGQKIIQQASNPTADIDDLTIGAIEGAEQLIIVRERAIEPSPTVDEFVAGEIHYDWLIPDLLERGDRVMITGGEGNGKSVLTRQFAVCASAGVHPFTAKKFTPIRVLIIDLENPRTLLQRKLKPLIATAKAHGDYNPDRLRIESKPAGIDLGDPQDAAWFTEKIAASQPDLLVIGPLYRLHTQPLDKEDAARAITVILDRIRAQHRCALIVEAHSGHGFAGHRGWRPIGSSLFMRWPEFGYGLMTDRETWTATLLPWRGPRDEREWPQLLRRGRADNWPWVETIPEAENNQWRSA